MGILKYGTLLYLPVDAKVLMVKKEIRENDPNSGYYTLPGGNLENDEMKTPEGRLQRAVKETFEETGMKVINPKERGVILFDNSKRIFDNWKNPADFLVYIFSASSYYGILESSNEGIPMWIGKKDIPSLPQNPGDRMIYKWLEDLRFFRGVIRHNGKLLDEENTHVRYF